MADNSKKISELPTASNAALTDRILILRSPAANASVRTITVADFSANIVLSNTAPATSSSNGVAGAIRFDSGYVYVCVANNNWKRASLTTW
jgi:hypothetical protein